MYEEKAYEEIWIIELIYFFAYCQFECEHWEIENEQMFAIRTIDERKQYWFHGIEMVEYFAAVGWRY